MKLSRLTKLLLLLVLGVFLVVVFGYFWTKSYIQGEDFQNVVTKEIGKKVGGAVTVAETEWDGWRLENDKVQITAAHNFQDLEANRLSLELDSSGLFEGVWRVSNLNISELSLKLVGPKWEGGKVSQRSPLNAKGYKSDMSHESLSEVGVEGDPTSKDESISKLKHMSLLWLPKTLEVDAVSIDNGRGVYAGHKTELIWDGVAVQLTRKEKDYRYQVSRGEVLLSAYPEIKWKVESCEGRFKPEAVFLNEAKLVSDDAILNLTGEKEFAGNGYLQGELRDLRVERLVPSDWKKKLGGLIQSSFTASLTESTSAKGSAEIRKANITALPMLDMIADKTGVQKFRSIHFDTCQMDYSLEGEIMSVSNVLLESKDFLKITGDYQHSSHSSSGQFQVGIADGVLPLMPSGTESIFAVNKDGYHWATVNVSYEDGKWKEDLSSRMVSAVLRSLLGGAGSTTSEVIQSLKEGVDKALEGGNESNDIINTGKELLDKGAKSLFDLLGK